MITLTKGNINNDMMNNDNHKKETEVSGSLLDYIYIEDGYIYAKQKLPKELEQEYNDYERKFYYNDSSIVKEILNKIKNLPNGSETTIAELINYNPDIKFVDPITQGIVSYTIELLCNENGILLIDFDDSFGGLAYYNKFKKTMNVKNVV